MRDSISELRNQRGAGLVVAMVVLLCITLLAAALMQNINTEKRITGENMSGSTALNLAESGVAEATERIRLGEIIDTGNPRMVAQIFLVPAGGAPVCGADTLALATWQTEPMLDYSSAGKGPHVLTVRYKTDVARTQIFRYDLKRNPRVQTLSGEPIFVITSTGRAGAVARTIVSEVIRAPVNVSAFAALAGRTRVQTLQDIHVCGYDHDGETPIGTAGTHGRDGSFGACNENPSFTHWELPGNSLPGVWTQARMPAALQGTVDGTPAIVENGQGFRTLSEMLNVTPADMSSVIGNPSTHDNAISLHGMRYYKPASGTLTILGGTGEGLLYVEGNVQIKGPLTYRGLIYCTGGLDFAARAWVLGSVVAAGPVRCLHTRQSVTILYSRDAVSESISRYSGRFITLAWRELQDATPKASAATGS